jgi:UDPglucose 6-dehydrogenase
MKIGFVGLGKLGLPTALALEARGHNVFGHDPAPNVAEILRTRHYPYHEEGVPELLAKTRVELRSLDDVVRDAELVFVTIQTPHAAAFEGVTRLPQERRDFDYAPLCAGVEAIGASLGRVAAPRDVAVVSTVLPGTMRREVLPRLGPYGRLCYNPAFIAMGTTIADFVDPEFVLLGGDNAEALATATSLYRSLHTAPIQRLSIEEAELTKVLYNTWISTKIAFANTVGELAHSCGADADRIMNTLQLGRRRLISPAYLRPGMGDGGGCHPRDNIALSWFSRARNISYDWFEAIMLQRERHTEWIARVALERAAGRPIVVLGKAFKAESTIVTGSPALLLLEMLRELGCEARAWDPYVDHAELAPAGAAFCYVVATKHKLFQEFPFEAGSTVIDPWRFIPPRPGVEVVRLGEGSAASP